MHRIACLSGTNAFCVNPLDSGLQGYTQSKCKCAALPLHRKTFHILQAGLHSRGKHLPWYEETLFVTSKAETDRYRYGDLAARKKKTGCGGKYERCVSESASLSSADGAGLATCALKALVPDGPC